MTINRECTRQITDAEHASKLADANKNPAHWHTIEVILELANPYSARSAAATDAWHMHSLKPLHSTSLQK